MKNNMKINLNEKESNYAKQESFNIKKLNEFSWTPTPPIKIKEVEDYYWDEENTNIRLLLDNGMSIEFNFYSPIGPPRFKEYEKCEIYFKNYYGELIYEGLGKEVKDRYWEQMLEHGDPLNSVIDILPYYLELL